MTTTSLKLPDDLKQDIHRIAAQCKTSPHAFMLQTLESEVQRRTLRAAFLAEAQAAADEIDAGAPVYALADVQVWVKAKIESRTTGRKVKDPVSIRTRSAASGKRAKSA